MLATEAIHMARSSRFRLRADDGSGVALPVRAGAPSAVAGSSAAMVTLIAAAAVPAVAIVRNSRRPIPDITPDGLAGGTDVVRA